MPTSSMYTDGTYATRNPTLDSEHSEWKAGQILKAIKLARLQPRTVAEIGCGAGLILASLKKQLPAEYSGFDISEYAINTAKANEGICFHVGSVEQIHSEYDLVLGIDVIEHVEDVFGFLRDIRKVGRTFVFHIPLDMNCNSLMRGFVMGNREGVGHLHYFSKETALATLTDCGYTIKHYFYTRCGDVCPGRADFVRDAMFRISPDTTVKLLGGYSLMVVAHKGIREQ